MEKAQDELNAARAALPDMSAIDNGDMDPKNIMWHNGEAHVIDQECLCRGNPISTVLDLALQWSGTVNESFCSDNLKVFFDGYLHAYDNGFRSYEDLFGIAYTWVECWNITSAVHWVRKVIGRKRFLLEKLKCGIQLEGSGICKG